MVLFVQRVQKVLLITLACPFCKGRADRLTLKKFSDQSFYAGICPSARAYAVLSA